MIEDEDDQELIIIEDNCENEAEVKPEEVASESSEDRFNNNM